MLEEKVRLALEEVRPVLQRDGGDVELVSVSADGVVEVKLTGHCAHCAMSQMTVRMVIEGVLREKVPEVKEVRSSNGAGDYGFGDFDFEDEFGEAA